MTISLCMITKNEEAYVKQAINSVKNLVGEIIIVDTGSTDKTITIAKSLGAKVFEKPWNNNFAEARNESIKHATKNWILILDADEVIAKEDHKTIKNITENPNYLAYSLIQVSYTNDPTQFTFTPVKERTKETKDFEGYISCNIIRLFKNHAGIKFANPVHESVDHSIPYKNKIKKTDLKIHHYQFERGNEDQKEKQLKYLSIYEEKINEFTNKAKVYRDIGIIYYSFKQAYDKAIENFKKSLHYNPTNIKTYVGLALALVKKGNYTEALKTAEKAHSIAPENQQIKQLLNHIKQAKKD